MRVSRHNGVGFIVLSPYKGGNSPLYLHHYVNTKMKTTLYYILTTAPLIVLGIGIVGLFWITVDNCDKCNYCEDLITYGDRVKLFDPNNADMFVNGVYFKGDEYYCVYVGDRKPNEVKETDYHEMCHHFIYEDYEHFCGDEE